MRDRDRARERERRPTRRTTGFFDLLLPPTTGKSRPNHFRHHFPLLSQCPPFCFFNFFFFLVLSSRCRFAFRENGIQNQENGIRNIYMKTFVSLRVSRLLVRNGVSPHHVSCPVHGSRLGYVKHEPLSPGLCARFLACSFI